MRLPLPADAPARGVAAASVPGRGTLRVAAVAFLVAALVALVFSPVVNHGFVNADDDGYLTANPRVQQGLTARGVAWAFRTTAMGNWHPLTWISHMLDVQLFGMRPAGHHLVSLLLHAANAVLVFLVLRRMTGALWRSGAAAALFAVHPLRVESVAWASERKDVLCAFFVLAALAAYLRYARKPSLRRYLAVLLCLVLALLAKPMAVTLPLVLLLLDWWPLGRAAPAAGSRGGAAGRMASARLAIVAEKIPLLAASLAVGVVTYTVQARSGAVVSEAFLPYRARVGNAALSCLAYLRKTAWPSDLAAVYPHPGAEIHVRSAVAAGALLLLLTALALRQARRRPAIAVGWFWFLVTLLPVIGLVQVGGQGLADRYTYLPHVGFALLLAGSVPQCPPGWRRRFIAFLAAAAIATLAIVARRQLGFWTDSATLFERALAVGGESWMAHNNLGAALAARGGTEQALAHYRRALALAPRNVDVLRNLGLLLAESGSPGAAVDVYDQALRINPHDAETWARLGHAQGLLGRRDEAVSSYREALRIDAGHLLALNNLGAALAAQGDLDGAIALYRRALLVDPRYAPAHNNLGLALASSGALDEAARHYREALAADARDVFAMNNLANVLSAQGNKEEAIALYRRAIALDPRSTEAAYNLALELVARGDDEEAAGLLGGVLRAKPGDRQAGAALAAILKRRGRPRE